MKKRTRSILQELNTVGRSRNNDHLIEATGNNIIESAINLLNRTPNAQTNQLIPNR